MSDRPPKFDLSERITMLCKSSPGAIYSTRQWHAPLSDKMFHLAVFRSGVEDWTSGVYVTPEMCYCDIRGQMLQRKVTEANEQETEKAE